MSKPAASIDLTDALAYVNVILSDEQPRNFRFIKPGGKRIRNWIWTPDHSPADIERELTEAHEQGMNAYVTINPVRDESARTKDAASTEDIERRTFIPIDIDPKRRSGTLATEEQAEAARLVYDDLKEWYLTNFPDRTGPLCGFSGSGYHILIPCDLPADKESDDLVAGLLKSLNGTFGTATVKIDDLKDRPRIMRVCGTMAFYSNGSRQGRMISGPSESMPVLTVDDLRSIVSLPETTARHEPPIATLNGFHRGDVAKRLDRYIEPVLNDIRTAPEGTKHDVLNEKTFYIAGLAAGEHQHHRETEIKERIRQALHANPGHVASWDDANRTINDAWADGVQEPISLPDRDPPATRHDTASVRGGEAQAAYEGRDYHNPKVIAEAFVREEGHRIIYAAGVPYEYRDGVYRHLMPDDLRVMLHRFADDWFARHHEFEQGEGKGKRGHKPIRPVTRKVMADLVGAHASVVATLGVVTFPSWSGKPPKGWTSANTVNCANGLLNIETLEFIDHTPKFMSLAKSKAAWDGEDAECPEFDKWLTQVLPGDDTEAENSRENLLAFMGYLLVPDRSIHKALSIVGQKRTGKGTVLRLIRKLVGEGNVATTSLTEISSRFGLEPLLGKLVASINDARPGKSNSDLSDGAERLLQITGGDTVSVDRKNRSALPSVDLPVRFVMASNGHLNMPDPNAVLPSRLVVIYFNTSFYGHENSAIEAAMERELPGILAKCVMAYRKMRGNGGFHELESTREAQEISERLAQPLVEFLGDVFKIDDSATWLSARDVYHAYVGWFTENCPGNKPMTFTRFRTEFGSCKADVTVRRPRKENDSREWFVFGVSLRDGNSFAALKRIGLGYVAKHAGIGTSGEPAV